jgi:cytohesin
MIAQGQGTAIKETCDALSMVIEMGQTETVPFLLDATMDINMRLSPLHTPLSLAARLGRVDIVELLVDRGAEMEARPDATQSTPLIMAAENGREGVMWLLLAAGANPDVFDKKGFTPLHYVARAGKENAVRLLLASNADTSFRDGQDGKTAEELASEMGHRDVAVLLSSSLGRSPICQSCVDSTVP